MSKRISKNDDMKNDKDNYKLENEKIFDNYIQNQKPEEDKETSGQGGGYQKNSSKSKPKAAKKPPQKPKQAKATKPAKAAKATKKTKT